MLRFSKLRLAGFKSFVDPTEIKIEPGLSGVVGPNGCGKSNLVEALKWVMGEVSAKQMRGSAMDDVIFGGSTHRPARNMAEVVLHLDNAMRTAPAMFNDADELEVVRRIERGHGSAYRVNGKEVRAKDVQLLFADAASGSRSTAMVSQGKVSQIISAKPSDRRIILEEAAGITGLHSRRHEAELRLRGAETNLSRLDDILITLEGQLQSLKKQARQATRYRNLSDHIKRAEALRFHIRWGQALDTLEQNRDQLKAAQSIVAERTATAAASVTQQTNAAQIVPALRRDETEAAAQLQRLTLARDGLDDEVKRIESARLDRVHRAEQLSHDITRERALAEDAAQAMVRLEAQKNDLASAREGEQPAIDEAAKNLDEVSAEVLALETQHTELTEKLAADEAQRASLMRSVQDLETRLERLSQRIGELNAQHHELERETTDASALAGTEDAQDIARDAVETARTHLENTEAEALRTEEASNQARNHLQDARLGLSRLEAEEQAMAKLLETRAPKTYPPLLDALTVDAGYEAALGAALGEDLDASNDADAPVHWTLHDALDAAPGLPAGVRSLAAVTQAPAVLHLRLSQIGVVENTAMGTRLARDLKQGQRLVNRNGALWRWDGYRINEGARTAATVRLEQLNRLKDVRVQLQGAATLLSKTQATADAARQKSETARDQERAARADLRERDTQYTQARDELGALRARLAQHNAKYEAVSAAVATAQNDINETRTLKVEAENTLADFPDTAHARKALMDARETLTDKRAALLECQSTYTGLKRAAEDRTRRLSNMDQELTSWHQRREGARQRIEELEARTAEIRQELETLTKRPDEIREKREHLLALIEAAQNKRKDAADRLAEAENTLADTGRTLREAESNLAQARETQVRIEGAVEQGKQACASVVQQIREKLDSAPGDLITLAEIDAHTPLPALDSVERKAERLTRERDTMGPVNLRAEEEAREMGEQIETLETERSDLLDAIAKLRRGIHALNREGRERLLSSFREVNRHFQELFVRLFGGGEAHLKLIEADDPLESGLEIMASPPGKRMQVLSLLSGGEQALTATALLFAVFMTNPAPICVLDEVDAPLDDANVDRFCTLLEEIAASGATRFLIITHHRMTMARMERLFGVTMTERGVSQLVSVNLDQAEDIHESA